MPREFLPFGTGAAIFLAAFAGFILSPIHISYDSIFTIHRAYSLLHGQGGALDAFLAISPGHYSARLTPDGHWQSIYPIGPTLFALPLVAMIDAIVPDLEYVLFNHLAREALEVIIASLVCAAAAVMVWRLALLAGWARAVALAAAAIFAVASPIWSSATRGLWQHGPVVFCALAAWLALRRAEHEPARAAGWIALTALFVGLMFLSRPLAIAFVLPFTAFVAWFHRRHFLVYALVGTAMAAAWLVFNRTTYGVWIPWYYDFASFSRLAGTWIERAAGQWVSPGRGILVFSPIFVISLIGPIVKWRARRFDRHDGFAVACVVLLAFLLGRSPSWWGGASYGPRLMADAVPFLVYLGLPVLGFAFQAALSARIWAARAGLAALFAVSVAFNLPGAVFESPYEWNAVPHSVDSAAGNPRLWEWSDPQFLRFRRSRPIRIFSLGRWLGERRDSSAPRGTFIAGVNVLPIAWGAGWRAWHAGGRALDADAASLEWHPGADLARGGRLLARVTVAWNAERFVDLAFRAGGADLARQRIESPARFADIWMEIPPGALHGETLTLHIERSPPTVVPSASDVSLAGLVYVPR